MTTKVAVIGAKGRMGATACEAVDGAADLELVGRFDEGDDLGDLGGADVVVEEPTELREAVVSRLRAVATQHEGSPR